LLAAFFFGAHAAPQWTRQQDKGAESNLQQPDVAGVPGKLLDIAFDAVSKMPVDPHIKNRSRAQELVFEACLKIEDPTRARAYLERIQNWRQGAACADLALFLAKKEGDSPAVEQLLNRAGEVANWPQERIQQAWRKDRILAKIARAQYFLGDEERGSKTESRIETEAAGSVRADPAAALAEDAVDDYTAKLESVLLAGQFDAVRAALAASVDLYDRFFENAATRGRIETAVKEAYGKVPMPIVLDVLLQFADAAIHHDDDAKALALIEEGEGLMDTAKWLARDRIPLMARFAERRARAGEPEKARAELDSALGLFARERNQIVDIFRADALIPLARSYIAMGAAQVARTVYQRALAEAVVNPNSRPRADDLSAICISMAVNGFAPDRHLWKQIELVSKGLGSPW